MNQAAVLERVLGWARADDNVRALVLTGSLAGNDGTADAYSDLDVELYVADPALLLENDDWFHRFGEVLVVEALENPGWNPTRLVYYAGGKIDFMVAPVSVAAGGVRYDRPFQALIDKDGLGNAFGVEPRPGGQPPAAAEFLRCINWFYAAAIMWAKYLARGDPWAAKVRDWDSKTQLLQMMEWDHKARKGWEYDTWHHGLRMRDWMDPELLPRLEECWSGFSPTDSVRALRASLDLFDALSTRTAVALGIEPIESARVRRRVEQLLGADDENRSRV